MSHNIPWVISDRAVDDLLRITNRHRERLPDALEELRDYVRDIITRHRQPLILASGCQQYRTARPLRLRLIVRPSPSRIPELVEVRPDHEGRLAAYTYSRSRKSATHG